MPDYIYPTSAELREVERNQLPVLTADDPIFDVFPTEEDDAELLIWEQQDDLYGLMQVRGINGSPPLVTPVGARQYIHRPSYYGEVMTVDEMEITRRRRYGTFNQPIDLTTPVRERQDQLITRQLQRLRHECWTLLATGLYQVLDAAGVVVEQVSYSQRKYTATVPWSTIATATPLLDFRNVKLMARGYSLTFGQAANAYMNSTTSNYLYANTNPADLYGRRTQGLGTFNSPEQIAQLLTGDNLPRIVEYDETYKDDNKVTRTFIPDNVVIVVGKRLTGTRLGAFRMTRNANNPDAGPGVYTFVHDNQGIRVPRTIEVHRGFNGGPILFFSTGIIVMFV